MNKWNDERRERSLNTNEKKKKEEKNMDSIIEIKFFYYKNILDYLSFLIYLLFNYFKYPNISIRK